MTSTATYGETQAFGRNDSGGQYQARFVNVGDDTFVEAYGVFYDVCGRCELNSPGTTVFGYVLDGVCFACNGIGRKGQVATSEADLVKVATRRAKARARAAVKREAAQAAKLAEMDAALAAWSAKFPEAAEAAALVYATRPDYNHYTDDGEASYEEYEAWAEGWGRFVVDLSEQATYRPLSEKQSDALVDAVAKSFAEMMAKADRSDASRYMDVPTGAKVAVTGVVEVATSVPTSDYYGRPSSAMLVVVKGTGEFEGITVKAFGSGKTLWDAEQGQAVTMSGSVKKFEEYEGVKQTVITRAKVTQEKAA